MVHDPAFVAACDKRHLMLSSGERAIFPVIDTSIPSWFLPRGYTLSGQLGTRFTAGNCVRCPAEFATPDETAFLLSN